MIQRFKYSLFLLAALSTVLLGGCDISLNLDDPLDPGTVDDAPLDIQDPGYRAGVEFALQKAEQITGLRWRPVGRIPKANKPDEFFEPGVLYPGLPYSSVKEMDKFVGQDVSFYTFLSAVDNPRSVLYTEVVNEDPYHGTNCAPYYGTVCSMSISYVLGLNATYPSRDLRQKPFMKKISDNDIDALEVGDILASTGHTIMVVDVVREGDRVSEVTIFENSSYVTRNREEMVTHWADSRYGHFRYRNFAQNSFFVPVEVPEKNPALCVNRGDKAVYRSDETVVVNILDGSFKEVVLSRDGEVVETRPYQGEDQAWQNLPEGLYSVRLTDEGRASDETQFEVLDLKMSVEVQKKRIVVSFDGNTVPAVSVSLCEISGRQLFTEPVDDAQNRAGSLILDKVSSSEPYYCKLLFQGRYGKIAPKMAFIE